MQNIESTIKTIQSTLFSQQDIKFKEFQYKLIPFSKTAEKMIGVRTPFLRSYAKTLSKAEEGLIFIEKLPHDYFEEYNLHGFIIETLNDYNTTIYQLDRFLPFIDNWATCDLISPKSFKKNRAELEKKIHEWLSSDLIFTKRFAINMIMKFFLDDYFSLEFMNILSNINSEEYYLNMSIAWYFATALSKQYNDAIKVIKEKKLSVWVHNKSIQKAIESRRIDEETKIFLRTLKI
ncbi:MAG: DNA alkylation repair protein [Treponema sp.]|jgi:3-methyladenine DNA glycosylase AlkD|nr:DNA alkylation repair protein [Treponema sp.]